MSTQDKKLKILQINKYYYLKGGSERSVFDVSRILKDKGHIIIPFSMQDSMNKSSEYEKYFINKVNLEKFSLKNIIKFFLNFEAKKKLELLIKQEKPDIAHLHNIAHQLSPVIIRVLKKHNIPVVQTLHDYKLICPNYRLYNKNKVCYKCRNKKYYKCFINKCLKGSYLKSLLATLEAYFNNKVYDLVDLFIAPSEYMKEICVKFGVPEVRIKVLKHSINEKYFLDNSESGDYLLYFGRLSKEKGVDVLLKALAKSKSKIKIVGAGNEIKNYELRIKNYGLEDRVEILGPKYDDELIEVVSKARAIIMPSVWPENMPYSLLEAMALGKVVIASRIGGISEMIKNKENGFLFNYGNDEELANIIDSLDNYNLEKIGENARKKVETLNEDDFYYELIKIYKKVKNEIK